jgi:nucleoside phosphorylase
MNARAIALAVVAPALAAAPAQAAARPCTQRVLVLSAMPLELDPLVAHAEIQRTDRVGDRTFYSGTLAGRRVVLALTGIGLVNAQQTAQTALSHFRCGFAAVVFSGVAGSRQDIGDVVIPRRWTRDGGRTWTGVDPALLGAAGRLAGQTVPLAQNVPVGDAACLCPGVDAPTPVRLGRTPKVVVGGDGSSSDTYGGKALPCVPGGGDIAGCAPCLVGSAVPQDAAAFAAHAPSLVDPAFVKAFLQPPSPSTNVDSADQETAAVAEVARAHGVPFLGIRGVSDGAGDPLGLPGFPSQFVVYRQLAADNAAAVTVALLAKALTSTGGLSPF